MDPHGFFTVRYWPKETAGAQEMIRIMNHCEDISKADAAAQLLLPWACRQLDQISDKAENKGCASHLAARFPIVEVMWVSSEPTEPSGVCTNILASLSRCSSLTAVRSRCLPVSLFQPVFSLGAFLQIHLTSFISA